MNVIKEKKIKLKAKRAFLKQGTCSAAFFYLLSRDFRYPMKEEGQALEPLAGGILQQGYQCGMLWGASLAVGAESYRRSKNLDEAIALSIKTTQDILESFKNRTHTIECEEITKTDFNNKWSFAKFMFSGNFMSCLSLTGKWAQEAIQTANESLNVKPAELPFPIFSCASEVVKKMGGSESEMAMVAGFAGGLGLSGSGCGALAATIWKTVLGLIKEGIWKNSLSTPETEQIIKTFYQETEFKMECHEICRKRFNSIEEHSEFIKNGGCDKLINVLADI